MSRPPIGRIVAIFGALAFGFAGIVVRLVFLQVRDAPEYRSLAYEQRVRTVPLPATRGAILDRYGRDLALSLEARAVYADPRYIEDPEAVAAKMAPILRRRPIEILHAIKNPSSPSFAYIARQVDRDVAERVAALHLPGIGLLNESKRYYPSGQWGAPQVVGIVGVDGVGQGGLELEYEGILAGADGELKEEIDPAGRVIPQGVNVVRSPVAGRDLVTTIDPQLQYEAQTALRDSVKQNNAKGGTVIVMDPHTGDVLAMAIYQASEKKNDPEARLVNAAVAYVYEPGSVNKVITASAAIEEKKVSLDERFVVADSIRVYDATIHDAHPHSPEAMTLGDIITQSSNVGTIEVAKKLGPDLLATYLAKFGFGQPSGLGFPGESYGLLPARHEWSGTSMATLPIGQGVAVTPLQMAAVYATVANDGVSVQPRLVTGTVDGNGTFRPMPPSPSRRVVSEETAQTVTSMLAQVVRSGTGTAAEIPGYWVAGKTGTGKKPREDGSGYSHRYVASFIGFLPATDPEVVIAAIIDEPSTIYGGVAAAPVFQQLGNQAIARLHIPPGERPPSPPSAQRR